MKDQKGSLIILIMVGILIIVIAGSAYYLGTQNSPKTESPVNTQNLESEADTNISIKIEAGDLVVIKNGESKKITDWGYNSAPVFSPDKTKIAYLSKTEESLENAKKFQGYVPSSTNVWIINTDGSDPVKVTKHDNWVYRDNLIWLDNQRLLFTDGTSSAKVYGLSDKSLKNVLGSDNPVGVCVDACGGESRFLLSPNKKYLVLLSAEGIAGIFKPQQNEILNADTLESEKMNEKFITLNYESADFRGDNLYISSGEEPVDLLTTRKTSYNINLKTGEVSSL